MAQLPPEIPTVVGGYQATVEVEQLLERCPNIDMVVRGEGEEVIRRIVSGAPPREIRGLSYQENGRIVHNEIHLLPDIARLPFPDRALRRHAYAFTQHGVRLSRHTFDTVLTTRGCPFKCKFCTFSLNPLGQKRGYTERPVSEHSQGSDRAGIVGLPVDLLHPPEDLPKDPLGPGPRQGPLEGSLGKLFYCWRPDPPVFLGPGGITHEIPGLDQPGEHPVSLSFRNRQDSHHGGQVQRARAEVPELPLDLPGPGIDYLVVVSHFISFPLGERPPRPTSPPHALRPYVSASPAGHPRPLSGRRLQVVPV